MSEKKDNQKKSNTTGILIIITCLLSLLYALSFVKSCASSNKRQKIKTALVNQKYRDNINSIILQDSTGSIELTNKEGLGFWTIKKLTEEDNSESNLIISLPASSERIKKFLEELIKVRNLYKISDKININSSLGLTNGSEFHVRYTYTSPDSASESFRELIFGNQDFSLSSRYLMTGENTQVYEIDSSLDTFLTSSLQNWAEPFIISQLVLGKIAAEDIQRTQVHFLGERQSHTVSDLQKLLDLRHGGLAEEQELFFLSPEHAENPLAEIILELGNKNEIELQIYKSSNENEFIVIVYYKKARANTQKDTETFYYSASKISSWTYNKIKEITL